MAAKEKVDPMHVLVLMARRGNASAGDELQREHEQFIDGLDRMNKVVLGGSWKPAAAGFEGAYLLSCSSLDEAREIAASDPLVRADAIRCEGDRVGAGGGQPGRCRPKRAALFRLAVTPHPG